MQRSALLTRERRPLRSWQAKWMGRGIRTFVKPLAARIPFTPQVMKLSQLGFDIATLVLPVHSQVHIAPGRLGGVPGEWLKAGKNVLANRVLLYLHGGGYFFGSPRSHRSVTWRLSRDCHAKVFALDYRQPPDWGYPAPLEDAMAAYRALLDEGYLPENIIFAGDSAGGNLTLATLLKIRETGLPMPACAVLISPWCDLTCSGDSVTYNAKKEHMIPVNALRVISKSYAGHRSAKDPLISPVFADFSGFPPLLIQVGDGEVLYSDAERVAEGAQNAGVPCR